MQKINVLIVEDQLMAAKVAKSIMNNLDCNADVAPDGKTALQFLDQTHYDIVFMDVGLPDINGCELTRKIRKEKLISQLPIIALTARTDDGNREECISCGMNTVIAKPLMPTIAKDIINNYVYLGNNNR